jgi:hypothetical protein
MSRAPLWSREEKDFLERLVGDVPFVELLQALRKEGKRRKWPPRSDKAVAVKLADLGLRASARQGALLTTGGAAELLGCPAARIDGWLRRKRIRTILEPRWVGAVRYIERSAWRRLARERPQILGGFTADALFLLLEDRDLAEAVAAAYPRPIHDWRVRCVETGRIYSSCGAAAEAHHVSQACISLAIRQRRPVAALGLTFEALRHAAHPPQPLPFRNRAA